MPQLLAQNSLHEGRRNMSKRSFDLVADSNASRMAFDAHFKAFELPMRNARRWFKLLRMRSNAFERTGGALHA